MPESKAVSVGPGHTTFTVMPCRAGSRAKVLDNATRPPLQALKGFSTNDLTHTLHYLLKLPDNMKKLNGNGEFESGDAG